jgi:hypothetical protein
MMMLLVSEDRTLGKDDPIIQVYSKATSLLTDDGIQLTGLLENPSKTMI